MLISVSQPCYIDCKISEIKSIYKQTSLLLSCLEGIQFLVKFLVKTLNFVCLSALPQPC